MAKVFRLDDGVAEPPRSELIVLEALRCLPDDWFVFHSVRWQGPKHGRQGDGEADFIVLHRERGALVLEVKGGEIRLDHGRWISTDRAGRDHDIRNPFAQASDSKHALIRFLSELTPPFDIRVAHAVCFPSVDFDGRLGPAAPREITLYASDLLNTETSLDRICRHWALDRPFSVVDRERIVELLAPTVTIRKTLKTELERSEADLVRLTAEQQRLFRNLLGVRRLVTVGGPGTGKTLLALEHARLLATLGLRVRVVCYNELLGKELADAVEDEPAIDASTFHALCVRESRRAGLHVPVSPSQTWWDEEAPRILSEAIDRRGPMIDALIVDEGQDFAPAWFAALMSDIAEPVNGRMFVFADQRQELRRRDWRAGVPIDDTYVLSENCRNTLPIARRINSLYEEFGPEQGVAGAPPVFIQFEPSDDIVAMAIELGERLLDQERLSPEDMTILCDDPRMVAMLRETAIADRPVVSYGGKGVVCETIARFKGLEAAAILMVLTDRQDLPRDRVATTYVGLSRARSAAIVLACAGHPALVSPQRSGQPR